MKEFRIVLAPMPNITGYATNSDVNGYVLLVTDEAKSGYKAIEVSLKGYSKVRWTTGGSSENSETYSSHQDYFTNTAILWSKESAKTGGQITTGSHQFQFSLKFQAECPLPPSFRSSVGKIVYEVEAVLVQASAFKPNKKYSVELPFYPAIDPSRLSSAVMRPRILQAHKTLCCLCCASGPISITARIQRSGFCIGVGDSIPLEVDVENGSNRQISQLQAVVVKQVAYFAQRHRKIQRTNLLVISSGTPVQSGNRSSWKPYLSIPESTEPSIMLNTCSIIELCYILKVHAVVIGAFNPHAPHVEFKLILGNVPVTDNEGSQTLPPTALLPPPPYSPPYIPVTAATGLLQGFGDPIKYN